MANQVESIINLPPLAMYGLKLSNNATTPDSKVDISAGMCRDADNNVDMVLGAAFPNAENQTEAAPLVVDATVNGVNGLDTGSLAASTLYAVYLISDSQGYKETAGILTLATNSQPLMPLGYDSYRLLGWMASDGTSDFLKGVMTGSGNLRTWTYDLRIIVAASGVNTSYNDTDVSEAIPPQADAIGMFLLDFAANAAADTFNAKRFGGSGDTIQVVATVATGTADTFVNFECPVGLDTGVPTIEAKVSAGAYDLGVLGYKFAV